MKLYERDIEFLKAINIVPTKDTELDIDLKLDEFKITYTRFRKYILDSYIEEVESNNGETYYRLTEKAKELL